MGSRFFLESWVTGRGVGEIQEQLNHTVEWRTAWPWAGSELAPTASLPSRIAWNPSVDTRLC